LLIRETFSSHPGELAAGREGNVFHDARLGGHGRGRHDQSDDPGGNAAAVVQAAGAFARKPLAVEERQFRWGTIHFRNAGEVSWTYLAFRDSAPLRNAGE